MSLVANIWTALWWVWLFFLFLFSLVLKLYAKWGWWVSHIFLCVCSLIQIFFCFLFFLFFVFVLLLSYDFVLNPKMPVSLRYLISPLPGSRPCAAAWECTWTKQLWSWCRGSHLAVVFNEQQSFSHLTPVYPSDPCSEAFHCWFACWQPCFSLTLNPAYHHSLGLAAPRPLLWGAGLPCSHRSHTFLFGSFPELLKQSSGCVNCALHSVLLLVRSVQVSFTPGSEMLPFLWKTCDPVGQQVVFQQQRWDKLLSGPACSPGFSPDVLCTCELLSFP